MKRTILIAALAALLAMTVVAIGGGTVITQPIGQKRITGTCVGQVLVGVNADGTVVCESDDGGVTDGDKGDITVSSSGAAFTVDNGVVSLAKMADVATGRILGRVTAGTGTPEALTGTQATTLLDAFTSGLKGLAPASGGGTTNYLRADGTWASPPGAGDITGVTVTSPACSAGSFMTTLTGGASSGDAPVGGTCTSEVGDISGVTAGEGLTGGGTSGTVSVAVNRTISDVGQLLNVRYDNWSPASLSTAAVFHVSAADNWGSLVTGIDAIGSSIPLGREITICNTGAPQDDGILAFAPENTNSTANNRIWTPAYGREIGQTPVERYTLGPSACVDLIYTTPIHADSSTKRWVIKDNERLAHLAVQQLGLFPMTYPAAITGTVENWDPDNAIGGCPTGDSCEAGSSMKSSSYTWMVIDTVDSTGATIGGLKYTNSVLADGQGPLKYLLNVGTGPVTLTNGSAGSSTINTFYFAAGSESRANVVLKPGDGILLAHLRDGGYWYPVGGKSDYYFDARSINATQGLSVQGAQSGIGINSTLLVSDAQTSIAENRSMLYASNAGATYNTAAASYTSIIGDFSNTGTKSGANQLANYAIRAGASGGNSNYAIVTTSGNIYLGLGGAMTTFYANATGSHFSGTVSSQGNFKVGSSDFGGTTSFMVSAASGEVFAGDTASSAGSNNVDMITVGDTGTGQATTAKALIKLTDSGTYTTAGGNVAVYGGNFAVTATESAGANVLTNVALRLSATSGDVNQGLWVDDGSAQFDGAVNIDGTLTISATAQIRTGTGTPESAVTAPVGSIFLRTDGGATTTLYVKESGAGNTGWIAK